MDPAPAPGFATVCARTSDQLCRGQPAPHLSRLHPSHAGPQACIPSAKDWPQCELVWDADRVAWRTRGGRRPLGVPTGRGVRAASSACPPERRGCARFPRRAGHPQTRGVPRWVIGTTRKPSGGQQLRSHPHTREVACCWADSEFRQTAHGAQVRRPLQAGPELRKPARRQRQSQTRHSFVQPCTARSTQFETSGKHDTIECLARSVPVEQFDLLSAHGGPCNLGHSLAGAAAANDQRESSGDVLWQAAARPSRSDVLTPLDQTCLALKLGQALGSQPARILIKGPNTPLMARHQRRWRRSPARQRENSLGSAQAPTNDRDALSGGDILNATEVVVPARRRHQGRRDLR